MRLHRGLGALCVVSLMATAPLAHAAGAAGGVPDNVAKARALAEEAGDLLDSKKYAEALERVTNAESLYHAPTHELMLGQANEGLGHLALALSLYEKLAAEPIPPSAPRAFVDAQQTGKKLLSALIARVPSLLVVVRGHGPGGATPEVTIDNEPYSVESGAAKPADPGPHTVVVRVAGRDPIEKSIVLPDRGGVVNLEVTIGADKSEDKTTTSLPAPVFLPAALKEQSSSGGADTASSHGGGSLVPALIGFGVGAVGLGVGAVTGAMSMSKVSDIKKSCPGNQCPSSEQSDIDSTKTLGTVSTVGFIVGGVGVAAGAVLLLLRPSSGGDPSAASAKTTFAPWIGVGSCGVDGTF